MTTAVFALLVLHILTDLSFQTEKIATNKRLFNRYMILHILISSLALGIVFFLSLSPLQATKAIIIWFLTHLFLDATKKELTLFKPAWHWPLFGFDQIAHTFTIFLIAKLFY